MATDPTDQLRRSWDENAAVWQETVRERKIESRRVATDAAILAAVVAQQPRTVLDLGCGEGWLSRALGSHGISASGIDGSDALIRAARELGGGTFHTMSYEDLVADPAALGQQFDVVVANFSLLGEPLVDLLVATRSLLHPMGSLIMQTVHPSFAGGEGPCEDGWRVETFATLEGEWRQPMPWYFRTMESWKRLLAAAGYGISELQEPLHPERREPLSVIFVCKPHS